MVGRGRVKITNDARNSIRGLAIPRLQTPAVPVSSPALAGRCARTLTHRVTQSLDVQYGSLFDSINDSLLTTPQPGRDISLTNSTRGRRRSLSVLFKTASRPSWVV